MDAQGCVGVGTGGVVLLRRCTRNANEARGVLRNGIDMAPISVRPATHNGTEP
jgi:hypothetical protein